VTAYLKVNPCVVNPSVVAASFISGLVGAQAASGYGVSQSGGGARTVSGVVVMATEGGRVPPTGRGDSAPRRRIVIIICFTTTPFTKASA
jgi:hypothetical protein